MLTPTSVHTSIVVPTRNHVAMLARLVNGLVDTARDFHQGVELIVVDNDSDEPELSSYLQDLESQTHMPFASIKVLRYPHKFNYAAINNLAATHSLGEYLCFLNNDIEVIHTGWLAALCDPLQRDNTGCVGAMLYYPDHTIQHAGVFLDANNIAGHLYKNSPRGTSGHDNFLLSEQIVSAVTAACLLVRKTVFEEVGGFNESFAVAFNDVDFCLKVQHAGYQNIWTPHAELYHHESKSRGRSHERNLLQKLRHRKDVRLMKRLWPSQLSNKTHSSD